MSGSRTYAFRLEADASQLEAEYARARSSTTSFQSATDAFVASLNAAGRPVDAFTASLGRITGDMGKAERATRTQATAFSALVAGLDPVEAAYQKAARAEAMMTDLTVRGIEVTDRQKRAVAGLRSDYESLAQAEIAAARAQEIASRGSQQVRGAHDATAGSLQRLGSSAGVTRQQVQQLTPQFNDLFVTIASGGGAMQGLIQQGPQITQIFGGVGATFAAIAASIGPVGLAAGAATLAVGGLMLAFNSQQGRLADLRSSLRGLAGDYAALAPVVEKAAERVAQSGIGVSREDATASMVRLRQGAPAGSVFDFEEMTKQAADFARVIGVDVVAGADRLARGMRDPAALVKELAERNFPGMTEALRRTVEEMVAAGQRGEAFDLILSKINERTRGAAKDVAPLTQGVRDLKQSWSDFTDVVSPWIETGGKALLDFFTGLARRIGGVVGGLSSLSTGMGRAFTSSGSSTFGDADLDRFEQALIQRENPQRNIRAVNQYGYAGLYQMGAAALQTAGVYVPAPGENLSRNQFSGTFQIPGQPEVRTFGDFLGNEAAQREAFRQHVNKLNDLLDAVPGAEGYNRAGLLSVAHGYGPTAAAEFIRNGGRSDRADGNGVRLDDTYRKFTEQATAAVQTAERAIRQENGPPGQVIEVAPRSRAVQAADEVMEGRNTRSRTAELRQRSADTLDAALRAPDLDQSSAKAKAYREALEQLRAEIVSLRDPMDEVRERGERQSRLYQVQEGAARDLARAEQEGAEAAEKAGKNAADQIIAGLEARRRKQGELDEGFRRAITTQEQATSVTRAAADATLRGAGAAQEATIRRQAEIEALKYAAAGTDTYRQRVEALVTAKRNQKAADVDLGTLNLIAQQREEITLLEKEAQFIGLTVEQRQAEVAVLRERARVIKENGDPDSATSLQSQANIRRAASQRASNQQLENSWNDLARAGEQAFDRVGSAITETLVNGQGKAVNFGNVFKAVLADIAQSILRLAVLNPVLNSLFGGNRGSLGGVLTVAGQQYAPVSDASGTGGSSGGLMNYAGQAQQAYSLYGKINGGSSGPNVIQQFSPGYDWTSNSYVSGFDSTFNTGVGSWLNSPVATTATTAAMAGNAGTATSTAYNSAMFAANPAAGYGSALGTQVGAQASATTLGAPATTGTIAGSLGGAAAGIGGAYAAYQGFNRGGVGGNIQGVGGTAMAGMGAYAAIAGSMAAVPVYGWIAAAVLMIVGALLPGAKPTNAEQNVTANTLTGILDKGGQMGSKFSQANADQANSIVSALTKMAGEVGKATGMSAAPDLNFKVGAGSRDGVYFEDLSAGGGKVHRWGNDVQDGPEALARVAMQSFLMAAARQAPDENVRRVIGASSDRNKGEPEAILADLSWYKETYQALTETGAKATQWGKSLEALNASWDAAKDKAKELTLATDVLAAKQAQAVAKATRERDLNLQGIGLGLEMELAQARGGTGMEQIAALQRMQFAVQTEQRRTALEDQLTQMGASAAEVTARLKVLADIAAVSGVTLEKNLAAAKDAPRADFWAASRQVEGRGYINDLMGLRTANDNAYGARRAAGVSDRDIESLYAGQVRGVLSQLSSDQLRDVATSLASVDNAAATLARSMIATAEATERTAKLTTERDALRTLGNQAGILRSFLDQEGTGAGASPQAAFLSAQDAYGRALEAARRAGAGTADLGAVTGAAQSLLSASSAFYGDGAEGSMVRSGVLSQVRGLGAALDLPGFSDRWEGATARLIASQSSAAAVTQALRDEIAGLREEFRSGRLRIAA